MKGGILMKRLFLVVCGIALLAFIGWTSYGQKQNSGKTTWEYMVKSDSSLYGQRTDLGSLGVEGWELVAVTTRDQIAGSNQLNIETKYYLKRQR